MNKINKKILFVVAVTFASFGFFACADNDYVPENEVTYFETFDLWTKANYPDVAQHKVKEGLYIQIHKNSAENAAKPTDSCYVEIEYSSLIPTQQYVANTDPALARQLGTFSFVTNYVPFKFRLANWGSYYGLTNAHYEAIKMMSPEDEAEIVVAPNYGYYYTLDRTTMYEGFRGNGAIASQNIAYIKLKLVRYVLDGVREAEMIADNYADEHGLTRLESGLYTKKTLINSNEADSVRKDTTLTLNYVGYLVNGFVFDTNIKEVAEDHNIFDATRKYTPHSYTYNESDTTGYSGMIKAFKPVIKSMRLGEKVTFICYPSLGYGASGKYGTTTSAGTVGTLIYTQTPLIFDIEIIKKEEEEN